MKKPKMELPDPNGIETSTPAFLEYYNDNIPASFPKVTIDQLEKFQTDHASLFSGTMDWTIDKHRKKLMDWLVSRPKPVV